MAHIYLIVFHCFLLANQIREHIGSDLFNELLAKKKMNLTESVHESFIFDYLRLVFKTPSEREMWSDC